MGGQMEFNRRVEGRLRSLGTEWERWGERGGKVESSGIANAWGLKRIRAGKGEEESLWTRTGKGIHLNGV